MRVRGNVHVRVIRHAELHFNSGIFASKDFSPSSLGELPRNYLHLGITFNSFLVFFCFSFLR